MPARTSVQIPGFSHVNPIPVASRIGPFLATGAITGRDPRTGEMAPTLEDQLVLVFEHIRAILEAAGGTCDDILKMTFHLVDPDDREVLNREWESMFPDPGSRPARQAIAADLGRGALVHCDLLAVLNGDS